MLVIAAAYVLTLTGIVLWAFEVKLQRWPLFVYGEPFVLRVGEDINGVRLVDRLVRLGYGTSLSAVASPGQWNQAGSGFDINLKYSPLRGQGIVSGPISISLDWNRISSIRLMRSLEDVKSIVLEPELISIVPPKGSAAELCRHVALESIPPLLIDAVVLTEDVRFFSHAGIDPAAIQRALKTNIKEWRYVEGGSTIPQQLIRMTLLNPEKTLWRKLNEILMAVAADSIYNKETILTAYLNRVYLGHWGPFPIKGVAEASYRLFGKDLSDLDAAECALIAATIRAPNIINPFRHPERARSRRNMILGLLFKAGKISRDTYEESLESPLKMLKPGASPVRGEAFLEMVKDGLRTDLNSATVQQDILTSLEPMLQAEADAQLRKLGDAGLQAHLLISRPDTGLIRAYLAPAGQKWSGSGGNLETLLPLAAIPALIPGKQDQMRFTLTSQILSADQAYDGATFRRAIEANRSLLVQRLIASVGAGAIVQTLREFGINAKADSDRIIDVKPLAPLEMARVYSLMATLGNAAALDPGISVPEAVNPEAKPQRSIVAVNPGAVFLVNHVLKGVIPAAGKDVSADKNWRFPSVFVSRDADGVWAVAYRPDALLLLRMPGPQADEKKIRRTITHLLPQSMPDNPGSGPVPEGIIFRKICVLSGLLATSTCLQVIREPFFKGTQPTEWCPHRHEVTPVRSELKR